MQEVTWGFREDAEEDIRSGDEALYAEKLDLDAIIARPDIKAHHVKAVKQIELKRKKLENLKRELENLGRKETEDNLSEGQMLRRHRLTEQIEEKTQELESLEETLRDDLLSRDDVPVVKKRPKEDSDMEDPYFDRTKREEEAAFLSFESMQARLDRLTAEQAEIVEKMTGVDEHEDSAEEDPLELYMKGVMQELKTENAQTLQQRLIDVNAQIESINAAMPHMKPSAPKKPAEAPVIALPPPPPPQVKPSKLYTATPKPVPRNDTSDFTVTEEDLETIYGNSKIKPQHMKAAARLKDEVWEPPSEQRGDGRTRLNDKYGY
mmetsp:Transcript_8129/g.15996  ORF Transcript_8129/g.15996 Transcript_8129/m.15996 type:complete len:321 (-) Transcript_8129:4837-5799(-)